MSRRLILILGALCGLTISHAGAQTAAKGFDAFNLVRTRNIFDPARKATRVEASPETRSSTKTRSPSYFALTGTMVAEGRSLAFFTGSRAEFSKVVPVGEMVAGYKVVAITPLQTELERDGKSLVMAVGHRLQLEGPGDESSAPEVAAPDAVPSPSPSSSDPTAPAPAAPPASNDKAEILRRMMERRQKEMSK